MMGVFKIHFLVFSSVLIHHVFCQDVSPSSIIDTIISDLSFNTTEPSNIFQSNITSLLDGLKPPSFPEIAAEYGLTAEIYTVVTEDGYEITIFRFRGSRNSLPILLFHGITDSADTWVTRGNLSLGITLARRKYDVWFGNVRGNRYSKHSSLTREDRAYWNFSFHEHGVYDLAAIIDHILNNTGAAKLNMFGHSQGNAIIWVLLSTRTEYNDKINVATALAPVCYMHHIPPPIAFVIRALPPIYPLLSLVLTNLFGDYSIETTIFRIIGQIPVINYLIDGGILFSICGFDVEEVGPEFVKTAVMHFPTWTSLKNLNHFAQVGSRKTFARFDYGPVQNLVVYKSLTPPKYDLSKVKTKVVLLAARNDKLSALPDVDILRRQLPNVVQYVVNERRIMNHMDYIWGRNAADYLFGYIFDVLERYN